MLKVIEKSRRKPKAGDIFAFQLDSEADIYRFGRVVSAEAVVGPVTNFILVYAFEGTSTDRAKIPPLAVERLLFPPVIINRLPWSRGYFVHIKNQEFSENEKLPVHIFRNYG